MHRMIRAAACLLLVQTACSDVTAPERSSELTATARVSVAVNVSSASNVTSVRLAVTAADLPDTLWFQLAVNAGVAEGTAIVPAGPQRTFTLQALDADGIVWFEGSAVADVVPGLNPPLTIVLAPVDPDGEVPIIGQLGSYTLEISPPSVTFEVGQTMQLTAIVRDPAGDVIPDARAGWTTDDTRVAYFDGNGFLIAAGVGEIFIAAHWEGLKTQARITVTAP